MRNSQSTTRNGKRVNDLKADIDIILDSLKKNDHFASLAKDRVERVNQKLEVLLQEYRENSKNVDVVVEIAASYEFLGKYQHAYLYYCWALGLSNNDKIISLKVEQNKKRMEDQRSW